MPRAKKGSIQIRFEILEYLYYNPEPQTRTHIWRKATTLSYDDFQRYLIHLKEKGLIAEQEDGSYVITPKGREVYDKLRDVIFSIL